MAKTTRQTSIFGVEDWRKFYETFREADFQSYDFETLRKSFVDYFRRYYPETFNDYIESSEFVALLDVIAFMGQSLAFRNDMNARENFIDTAERRDSVVKLSKLVGYNAKRNRAAEGYLKVMSIRTTDDIVDFNGVNLANVTVNWNDSTNPDWLEQFTYILNAALVDSQRVGRPGNSATVLGVKTDEYAVNLAPGFLPVFPYNAIVDGMNMSFEAVSASTRGRDSVYEPAPQLGSTFNILYRNDQLGFASANTGYFFLFKQGVLQSQEFKLTDTVPNRTVNINIEGINDKDHWLFQIDAAGNTINEWRYVDSIHAANTVQKNARSRQVYSLTSRASDQVTLEFGDGVFADIPVGTFRSYVRASNGMQYVINPEEMQSIQIELGYISRVGRKETVTFICGLTEPVSNAQARESIDEIKQRAPARYYTQDRMVNGEDYNNFPFTKFNSIVKSKAVARSSIGTSRYTDLADITSKYSSTNIFAADGVLYQDPVMPTFGFEWASRSDIVNVINTRVEPALAARSMLHFYNATVPRPDLRPVGLVWNQRSTLVNETTGYFTVNEQPVTIGPVSSNATKFIAPGALIKFAAPTGYCFDVNGRIIPGTATGPGEQATVWATVSSLVDNGLPDAAAAVGPVTLNTYIPSGATPVEVIPKFASDIPTSIEQQILQQVELFRSFGLGYNSVLGTWYVINSSNLDRSDKFDLSTAGNTDNINGDSSWLIRFVTEGGAYTVNARGIDYVFASVIETRFFFDTARKVYDSKTGKIIKDFVKVLRTNHAPDSSLALAKDLELEIIAQPVESDGFVNDYRVVVSYSDSDTDGIADDPDFFNDIVSPTTAADRKLVFLQATVDFDNTESYLPVPAGVVNPVYATLLQAELAKAEHVAGQIFYIRNTNQFYELVVNLVNGDYVRTLVERTDFVAKVGRQDLQFQYRHNSPLSNLVDPGITNIIDLYVVTREYYTAYQNYIRDTTGSVAEPLTPTVAQLSASYATLEQHRMISDNIVLNSVKFKPLFGEKAESQLRASIKVVRNASSSASDSEIKSRVVAEINRYFTLDNWDFGSSFFFSELSAYLHQRLGSLISAAVLVPLDPYKSFGDLYEIRSAPNEIFVSAATVDNVDIVDALTASELKARHQLITSVTGQ